MRYSLIFLILFYSQIFCQSTLFVKYKDVSSLRKAQDQFADQKLSINKIDERANLKTQSLSKKFGKLNSSLNRILKIEIKNSEMAKNIVGDLELNENVEYVQISSSYKIDLDPNDSLYSQQWGLQSINAPEAWDILPAESENVLLAVIDTGIDLFHPDIDGVIYKNPGEIGVDNSGNDKSSNGIDDDKNGFIDDYQGWDFVDKLDISPISPKDDFTEWDNFPADEHGHGTNISGIIAAEHNSFGIAGVGRNIKLLNLRAFDKNGIGEEDDAASAIIYAVKMGAKVINMSWGDTQFSKLLKDVVEFAYENGVILVGSSGNTSSNLPHYPSSFSEVISVGAIQENNALAAFSNFGSTVDLVAPGSQIISLGLEGTYKSVSGTSASAPFVSAAAAIISNQKMFSNEEVKQIIKSTALDLGENGWDISFGAGNLDLAKAISILSPSEIKINNPKQDYYTISDTLLINISCLSPYFSSYELHYGLGFNPDNWIKLNTGKEEYQTFKEDIYNLDISNFSDTSYTLRLLVNRIDGNTQEERSNFFIDRSIPKIITHNLFPALLNDIETIQASIVTDDPTTVKLFYRKNNSGEEFDFISLDGFSNDVNMISTKNFGFLPIEEVIGGIDHELYFQCTNQSGLSSTLKDGENYFTFKNTLSRSLISNIIKNYNLPNGRLYKEPVNINGLNENFILINENDSSSDVSIYKYSELNEFEKVNKLRNKIPVSYGDFNNDGRTDLLNLFVKNGYIDSQTDNAKVTFENSFTDSSGTFWPAYADDIDNDNNTEIIAFSSDTSITIWEVNSNFDMTEEVTLSLSGLPIGNTKPIFRSNMVLVDNFDQDPEEEIIAVDNFGRLIVFQINGNSLYELDIIIEHFFPLAANSTFSKGDFNNDGALDLAIIMKFEENVYLTPLIYLSVISIDEDNINYLFQKMLITTESNFISSFEKQYSSVKLFDVNDNGSDDLIIFAFPNAYIFEYDDDLDKMLFYQPNVNSQSIFAGDIDNNRINEIGIPNDDEIYFHEFVNDDKIVPPLVLDYYSIDSQHIYIEWKNDDNPVYLFRGTDQDNLVLYDSTSARNYMDQVIRGVTYFYSFQYYNIIDKSKISLKSFPIEIFSHQPGYFSKINVLNASSFEIIYTQPINKKSLKLNNFRIDAQLIPNSITAVSSNQILINTSVPLEEGDHSLSINYLRDIYNTPLVDTTINYTIMANNLENKFLYVINYKIIDNYNLIVNYNFRLDSLTALNKDNYSFSPNNILKHINFNDIEHKSVKITTENPFGSIGREYVLKIRNIRSSSETGFLPINSNSGSVIVLTANADNLDDIYVYPNPINSSTEPTLTFANLTKKVDIFIFSIDGVFVRKITEEDGNGGVDWNLRDENNRIIGSGIYFYKAFSLDNFGNTLQEKIGKFAVVK